MVINTIMVIDNGDQYYYMVIYNSDQYYYGDI